MQLQNLLQHKRNTAVCVNGHVYKIAQDLVIRDDQGNPLDVPEADAAKLLGNKEAWRPLGAPPPKREEAKAQLKVILEDGSVVAPASRAEDVTKPAMEVSAAMAAQDAFEAKKQVDAPVSKDPPIPAKEEDWADPSEACSMEWLTACAKAYKIKLKSKDDKAAMVKKIKAAMYE